MTDNLVERLRNWEHVYDEDDAKPEGSLYLEAADRIEGLKELLWAAENDANEAEAYAGELEANLAEQIEWVKQLADDLIAAEGREARLKEKLAKAVEIAELFSGGVEYDYHGNIIGEEERKALAELEELTGGKDE